jgi:hypothetical protein
MFDSNRFPIKAKSSRSVAGLFHDFLEVMTIRPGMGDYASTGNCMGMQPRPRVG